MDGTERIIGELKEFKRHAIERLDRVETKVDKLQESRWMSRGAVAVLSVFLTMLAESVHLFWKG